MTAFPTPRPREDQALVTVAVTRAADAMGVKAAALARVLGVSAPSVSRMPEAYQLKQGRKEWELALMFLRVFRSLDAMLGGNRAQMAAWLTAENDHLQGRPLELIQSIEGIGRVAGYLDAMRG